MLSRAKLSHSTCNPRSMSYSANMFIVALCRQVSHPERCFASSTLHNCKFYLFALLVLLQWLNCPAIKLFPDRQPEPIFNRFVSYDGNLPAKLLSNWPIDQRAARQDVIDRNRLLSDSLGSLSGEQEESSSESSSSNSEQQSSGELLPRRERRMWNQWLQWFKPMNRISVGFMPVRGRKATFIAARGKKSDLTTLPITSIPGFHGPQVLKSGTSSTDKVKVLYYLVALTFKPISASEVDVD